MMRFAGTRACATSTTSAPPQLTTGTRVGSLMGVLADPKARLGIGTVALHVTALAVSRDRVGLGEAGVFRAVNGLPDALHAPAWAVMQLGTLGAAPAAAGAAWLAGDRELAGRLLASGTGTWALSKLVKQMVRRPRPAALLAGTRCRGRDAAGLGYLSGHAGVAVALGAAALPRLGSARDRGHGAADHRRSQCSELHDGPQRRMQLVRKVVDLQHQGCLCTPDRATANGKDTAPEGCPRRRS